MDVKGTLKAITLELRRELEGRYDARGAWQPGDLDRRLGAIGVRRDRAPVPVDELPHLAAEDREARRVIDAFLQSRADAGQSRDAAIADFVRNAAYTWANRLLALRCMEARSLIDEVILQKEAYGGRSLQHNRLAKKQPEICAGEDEGLFAALFDEFTRRAQELPLLFDPRAPEVALRPSVAALKRCVALLSGSLAAKGQERATDEVFTAPDALGWTYQYWNTEEKDRVFEKIRTKKGSKIAGAELVPATCIYTEPYMVKFLVQNSLGALWTGMHPDSLLSQEWAYYVRDADRAPVPKKPVTDITFLDPACGSGHFLIEAFELFYAMYLEDGALTDPAQICASILERNLYGIDIDERAAQIAALALVMKAKEKALDFVPRRVNLVATNIRLPASKEHLEAFLRKHPDDAPLKPALLAIFEGLAHADELGSLLQIEEPVDRELRHLRDQQLAREHKAGAGTLFGPRKDEDWSAWKHEVVHRLREHFSADAQDTDLATAFFGEAASKGLSLVDLLARRYDVVAANPPYMGSKNMGPVLKEFLERHFAAGKRDLYSAFILRCLELSPDGGRVAMVTQQSWMFLRSFADLRALDQERQRNAPRAFGGVLRETSIEALVHLGPRAFGEIAGEVVNTALFVVAKTEPAPRHCLTAFRLVGPKSPQEKDSLLCSTIRNLSGHVGTSRRIVSRPPQARFLTIPQAPLCYWLRERFFELLAGRKLEEIADVCQGLATADDGRFVRFFWEVPHQQCLGPMPQRRWVLFEKGGGYGKWFGHHLWVVEWQHQGARIKATGRAYTRNEDRYFATGWTYTWVARGSLGIRRMSDPAIIAGAASSGIYERKPYPAIAAVLSCRFASAIVRGLSAKIQLPESSVIRVPVPESVPPVLGELESTAIALKRRLIALEPTERTFGGIPLRRASLAETWRHMANETDAVTAVLHTIEGISEREVFRAYGIDGDDLEAILDETGTPAGWFPLVTGYDDFPEVDPALSMPAAIAKPFGHAGRMVSKDALPELKERLCAAYEAGAGGRVDEEEPTSGLDGAEDEEEGEAVSGTRVAIPTETFLEDLSQRLEIHPISVSRLLHELREKDGVVSNPGLARFVEDYLSVMVLRLLGHQWPLEVEGHEPLPTYADKDGIIPLVEGTSEPSLLARVRGRLAEDFGAARVATIEREFEEITSRALGAWLCSDYFRRHISQFRKRPIAWHITSTAGTTTRHRGRGGAQQAPAFSCLVYCHRLDGDLIPKMRTQYVGPLRTSLQTELASLEKVKDRSTDQDARRLELEAKIEELKAFDARLEKMIVEGFATPALDKLAVKEPLDKWTSRDGNARLPTTGDAFLSQERRYDPDLNDGVRVNIAPLQRAGLLAVDVLAGKDVEKAIADRAAWRADERRWCREGKLPQPGWWPRKEGGR